MACECATDPRTYAPARAVVTGLNREWKETPRE
jgi:hypothetical protein